MFDMFPTLCYYYALDKYLEHESTLVMHWNLLIYRGSNNNSNTQIQSKMVQYANYRLKADKI